MAKRKKSARAPRRGCMARLVRVMLWVLGIFVVLGIAGALLNRNEGSDKAAIPAAPRAAQIAVATATDNAVGQATGVALPAETAMTAIETYKPTLAVAQATGVSLPVLTTLPTLSYPTVMPSPVATPANTIVPTPRAAELLLAEETVNRSADLSPATALPRATQVALATTLHTPTSTPIIVVKVVPTSTPVRMLSIAQGVDLANAKADAALVVVSWNLGLADAQIEAIAAQLAAFDGVDLWLLQEAGGDSTAAVLESAAEAGEGTDFAAVLGTSGDNIPLLTLYNADRFALLGVEELDAINTTGNARAPLVLHLSDTQSGVEFLAVNNHLYRSREEERDKQATLLNAWAQDQTLPILAGGDYNFDYDVPDGPSAADRGFDNLTENGVWTWVRPTALVPTECSDTWPCTYDDILDFLFVAGPARAWQASSQVIVRAGDFPDNAVNSDHRPVAGVFVPRETSQAVIEETPAAVARSPVAANAANLRSGPGTNFDVAGQVAQGTSLDVTGISSDGQWYQLGSGLWIAAFLVDGVGDSGELAQAVLPTAVAIPTAPTAVAVVEPATRGEMAVVVPVPENPLSEGSGLVIVGLDKGDEYAVIANTSDAPIDLAGWTLRSEKGSQDCALAGVLGAGEQLVISAKGDVAGYSCGFGGNIWNNSEYDPAVLLAPNGSEVSRYH